MESEIPSQGIKDLYAANNAAGRTKVTEDLLKRFPSLRDDKPVEPVKPVEEPSVEPEVPKKKGGASLGKARKR